MGIQEMLMDIHTWIKKYKIQNNFPKSHVNKISVEGNCITQNSPKLP